jgi:DNA-binding NarL/FixJ family response regulator
MDEMTIHQLDVTGSTPPELSGWYLRNGLNPQEADSAHSGVQVEADVVVMFTNEVTEETLASMRRLASETWNPRMRIVLVADRISEPQLRRAVRHGLVGFVQRSEVGMARVLQTVLNSEEGRARASHVLVRSLIDQIGSIQEHQVLEPRGLNAAGLKEREIVVLKLLAEGLDTAKIAGSLSYSERTIKNILARMMLRLGLRNRAHAIAYATRSGAI